MYDDTYLNELRVEDVPVAGLNRQHLLVVILETTRVVPFGGSLFMFDCLTIMKLSNPCSIGTFKIVHLIVFYSWKFDVVNIWNIVIG